MLLRRDDKVANSNGQGQPPKANSAHAHSSSKSEFSVRLCIFSSGFKPCRTILPPLPIMISGSNWRQQVVRDQLGHTSHMGSQSRSISPPVRLPVCISSFNIIVSPTSIWYIFGRCWYILRSMFLNNFWQMTSQPRLAPLRLRFIIVGGSIGGLAAAFALARAGHRVQVLEKKSSLVKVGLSRILIWIWRV